VNGPRRFLSGALLAALVGCASVPLPTGLDVARAKERGHETSLEELTTGRSVYLARCGTCHQHYSPSEFASADWPKWVDDMRERAKLAEAERARVLEYLVIMAEAPPPP
jgi:mono/diheme cytochrome c family protein